jgi:hypothetical protein
MMTPELLAAHA